jgi:transposase
LARVGRTPISGGNHPAGVQRFAYYVGRRCRTATIKDVAEELHLDWDS